MIYEGQYPVTVTGNATSNHFAVDDVIFFFGNQTYVSSGGAGVHTHDFMANAQLSVNLNCCANDSQGNVGCLSGGNLILSSRDYVNLLDENTGTGWLAAIIDYWANAIGGFV